MPSGTSSSKAKEPRLHPWFYPTLYAKNLRRFWPLWALYLVVWLLMLPLNLLARGPLGADKAVTVAEWVIDTLFHGVWISALFGLFAAMAVFSYLYSARSAVALHALPVRREGLFLTNWLSGFSFFLLPNLAVVLLTALSELYVAGEVTPLALLLWFLSMTLMEVFFYSFAVFCAMFTGNLVALPVFYGILNVLVLGMVFLLTNLADSFLFGVTVASPLLDGFTVWFTPVLQLLENLYFINRGGGAGPLHGFAYVLLYAFVGAALSILALLVYRRRQLETAGDIVSVGWVRPVFKYGVAFCSAVALGTALASFFFHAIPATAWALLGFLVLCGLVGYFAAEMLLRKSFRVFRQSWKGALAFSGVLVLFCCFLEFDLLGLERWVPAPGQVTTVALSGVSSAPYDSGNYTGVSLDSPEQVEAAAALHAAIVARKETLEHYAFETRWEDGSAGLNYMVEDSVNVCFDYATPTGPAYRDYTIPVTHALLADPTSPAALLNELINDPDVVLQSYFGSIPEGTAPIRAKLGVFTDREFLTVPADNVDLGPLLAAVKADMAAGNLGRRYLLDDEARYQNCYYNDLTLGFLMDDGSAKKGVPTADVSQDKDKSPSFSLVNEITVTLQPSAVNTLAELKRLGLIDDEHRLLTNPERLEWEKSLDDKAPLG